MTINLKTFFLLLLPLVWAHAVFALGQTPYVETNASPGSFPLAWKNISPGLLMDANDFAGVQRAAGDLQSDLRRVTGISIAQAINETNANVILIGTIGKSEIIDRLVREKKIDVSEISNQWESFLIQVVPEPLPGIKSALVIAGSDKRGTIYGIYDLSEQIGVSPWHWWADVPVQHHDALFVKAGKFIQGPPAVKYRGIFLNDEQPALGGWARAKFGGMNRGVYTNVFELLLRLKANYLWPAMWDNAFNEDDPMNPKLADEYGIVMGTSHHEPMLRAQQEWKRHGSGPWDYSTNSAVLHKFWDEGIERNKNYESIITLAMRGDGDMPMSEDANISLLERIVADQRKIISDRMTTNLAAVPQLWALYKEVQAYYEKGMRVPDDVTLLWCDDNWGNIRRLPTTEERKRSGGAGIYYHFDYVGDPRNYKWLNTNPLQKIWEQMNLAYNYGADRIWIVNVGDLKPMEFPIEFFLTLAWNPQTWPKEKISEFTELWAEREFGQEFAPQIADIISKYAKYNGRRKPELLEPGTFSLVNYQEAEKVLADWKAIATQAEDIYQKLPANARDAFFELVLYPTKASEIVNGLYIAAAKNHLYAAQGRASANDFAAEVKKLFQADADLAADYNHQLAGGKWNHMMDQTHIGYTYWQQPPSNSPPTTVEIKIPDAAQMGVVIEGSTNCWPDFAGEAALPDFDKFNQQSRYVEVFNRGQKPFEFHATTSAPWILLEETSGTIQKEKRVQVSVDWNKAPSGAINGLMKIFGGTNAVTVKVNGFNPLEPKADSIHGFVEADGYVSMEAEHFTKNVAATSARWEKIPGLGRTLSAMSIFSVTAASVTPPANSARLDYQMFLFHAGRVEVETILSPTLNFVPGRGLRFALSFDDQPPQIIDALAQNSSKDWGTSVKDSVRKIKTTFTLENSGAHTLKIWMVDPGIVLQKIVVDLGGVKLSYLGPPESFHQN